MDFDALFDAYYGPLRRYCHRLAGDADAGEDAAQETFVRLLEREPQGDRDGIRSWLFTVATHLIRDRVRVATNRRRLLDGNAAVVPEGPDGPDVAVERRERAQTARAALDTLPQRDRRILLLREEGLSYRELAQVLEVAPGSVGTLLARARRRFADAVREQGGGDESPG